jgi:hypothetical protein
MRLGAPYRRASLMRNSEHVGPYSRPCGAPLGGGSVFNERGTPLHAVCDLAFDQPLQREPFARSLANPQPQTVDRKP